jgi:S-adenosylmethionine hydrolase
MPARYDTVTFLSDYGRSDEFVGVVHSVLRALAPHAAVVDLSHDIAPYDIRAGGLLLARSAQYLCPGVVLAVVDPGVGTSRRGVAVEVGGGESVLVGPDNGLLAPAVAMCGGADRAVELTAPAYRLPAPGPTFDGRDVFAPAAGHLCAGVPLEELGPAIDPAGLLPGMLPVSHVEGDTMEVEVLWVDRYGNAQLNVGPDDVDGWAGPDEPVEVSWSSGVPGAGFPAADRPGGFESVGSRVAARVTSFAEVGPGRVGLVVDSYGLLALALDQGSVADELGLRAGSAVRLRRLADDEGGTSTGVTTPVALGSRPGAAPDDDPAPPAGEEVPR